MNSMTIAGKLGGDAEQKYTTGGESIVSFSVAVNRPKKGGEKQAPYWFRVAVFGKYGESILNFLTKGTTVAVQGELNARTYESKGETKLSLDINARQVSLLGGGQDRQNDDDDSFDPNTL